MKSKLLLAAFLVPCCFLAVGAAPGPGKEAKPGLPRRVPRAQGKIRVDGSPVETAWSGALRFTIDYQTGPMQMAPAPVPSECWILQDSSCLYAAFICHDPRPQEIRAHLADHDNIWNDDRVGVLLDTFNDGNRAFAFFVNPVGCRGDEIISRGGKKAWDASWDAIWDGAGKILEWGYTVEMAIPFHALQIDRGAADPTWGFTALRYYPRSLPYFMSSDRIDTNENCYICQFSKISGLAGTKPSKNVEIDPTLVWTRVDGRPEFPEGRMTKILEHGELGLSGRWNFLPNLALSAAVNPDFSQVEADAMQFAVNTRFALSYPEKRPFFLEGRDFFTTQVNAVYTRTIADPEWGVKVTGKEGNSVLGIMAARDRATNLLFPGSQGSQSATLSQAAWAGVLRYRYDVRDTAAVGVLLTDREGPGYGNRVVGVDGLFRIGLYDTLDVQVLATQTRYPGATAALFGQKRGNFTGGAASANYLHEERHWFWKAAALEYSPGFRADLGFVPQADFRKATAGGGYIYRGGPDGLVSRMELGSELYLSSDCRWRLFERELSGWLIVEGPLQTTLRVEAARRRFVYKDIPFDQFDHSYTLALTPSRDLKLNARLDLGDEVDYAETRPGSKLIWSAGAAYNFGRHLLADLRYSLDRLDVRGGRLFTAELPQVRLFYHFSRSLMFRGIAQWMRIHRSPALYSTPVAPLDQTFTTQLLLAYKLNPRTVLFLGYSDNYLGCPGASLLKKDQSLFVKLGYALGL